MRVVGAEDHVDPVGPLLDVASVLLSHAPADQDLQLRAIELLSLQGTEVPVELLIGLLADGARVEDHDVGVVDILHPMHPVRLEEAADPLGVVLVHLASVGTDEVAAALPGGRAQLLASGHAEHDRLRHELDEPRISGRSRWSGTPGSR